MSLEKGKAFLFPFPLLGPLLPPLAHLPSSLFSLARQPTCSPGLLLSLSLGRRSQAGVAQPVPCAPFLLRAEAQPEPNQPRAPSSPLSVLHLLQPRTGLSKCPRHPN